MMHNNVCCLFGRLEIHVVKIFMRQAQHMYVYLCNKEIIE